MWEHRERGSDVTTVDELIKYLEEAREEFGGETPVVLLYEGGDIDVTPVVVLQYALD
jgi:hypothetical protein